MSGSERFFTVGQITKAQGIRGEVRVFPSTDAPEQFTKLTEVRINNAWHKVEKARPHKNIILLKLEGVNDRNTAETLTGAYIEIRESQAAPLADDEYFVGDLIGLQVRDEDGAEIGVVADVFHTGANDVYVIKKAGEKFMIPAIKDVVLSVDLAEGVMVVRLMEGLLELVY